MEQRSLKIHASKFQFRFYLGIGSFLLILSLWLGYEIVVGKKFTEGFLITIFFALFTLALAYSQFTKFISYENGLLNLRSFFTNQKVNLGTLKSAIKDATAGKYPDTILRLEDDSGSTLVIKPGDYDAVDVKKLLELLYPYLFINRVEKNFTDFHAFIDPGSELPKSSMSHILKGTLLYLFLPCLALTILLIIWATIAKR